MSKKFFYICAGIFLLALSYHLGATNAGAARQTSNQIVAGINHVSAAHFVFTANGDVYFSENARGGSPYSLVNHVPIQP